MSSTGVSAVGVAEMGYETHWTIPFKTAKSFSDNSGFFEWILCLERGSLGLSVGGEMAVLLVVGTDCGCGVGEGFETEEARLSCIPNK